MRRPGASQARPEREGIEAAIEPYRIKSVEPIRLLDRRARQERLEEAGHNLFLLRSRDVFIDLLTDSGTGALSSEQWAAIMRADEAYAHAESYYRLAEAVSDVLGFSVFLPTHQGRAAEHLLFTTLLRPGDIVASNTLFDTTRANIEAVGAVGVDLPSPESADLSSDAPFKGNIDIDALRQVLEGPDGPRVRLVHVTVTNNSGGGQPVSLGNLIAARSLADRHGVPFWLDACRFAENAYFIQSREAAYQGRSIPQIVHGMFATCHGAIVSAKKDGLANIGGLLLVRHESTLTQRLRERLILTEGFPTYGGLAGRDLEAIAQGLREVVDEDYLRHRLGQVAFLAGLLRQQGVPLVWPPGGHAVYIDAAAFLPHLARDQFPAQALACHLYLEGGIRSVEVGHLMFGGGKDGSRPRPELVRLALPRRVYTESHLRYVSDVVSRVWKRRGSISGLRLESDPATPLRHFTATLRPVAAVRTPKTATAAPTC